MEPETANTTQLPSPFWLSNLHVTSRQFSTNTSRGPWNDCSGLLQQHQPPPLSRAHLEGSCHLWSWVVCPPSEQKIYSAWRGWIWPSLATSLQTSPGDTTLEHIPSTVQDSWSPSLHAVSKTLDMASISPSSQSQAPPRPIQLTCLISCFDCRGR